MANPDPNAMVLRFRPTQPEAVLTSAQKEFRNSGRWLVSVWVDAAREGEAEADVILRLLAASEIGGMEAANNPRYYVCASAQELIDRGFAFVKDGYDEEPELHFSVDMGPDPDIETVERFLEPFTAARRN